MKAIACTKYGSPDVLQLKEVEKPIPGDHDILIKVHATTVCSGDARIRGFNVPALYWLPVRLVMGVRKPKKEILGMSVSGIVEAIGKEVTSFKPGDPVFGSVNFGAGTHAEYTIVEKKGIVAIKPDSMSHEEAAALFFGGHTALHFLRKKGNIQAGQKVLIYGASGSLGTYGVQLAKHFGAEVTGVCSTANIDLVKSLGADKVIDYTRTDVGKNLEKYDIIFDTVGKSPFSACVRSLNKRGYYLRAVHMTPGPILHGLWTSITSSKKVVGGEAYEFTEDLIFLKELVEAGKIKPVIDKVYPLEQTAEAHRYMDTGRVKGNIVIKVI